MPTIVDYDKELLTLGRIERQLCPQSSRSAGQSPTLTFPSQSSISIFGPKFGKNSDRL
jgi:hypothetical protein